MAQTSILGRVGQLVRANINAILDGAEDPERMLEQLVRDFTNNIAEAEDAVAQTIGNLRMVEDDAREARSASVDWLDKAKAASRRADQLRAEGNAAEADRFDDLAKIALRRQVSFESSATTLETQVAAQTELADKLKDGLNKLRIKREELVDKRDELVSRAKMAQAQVQESLQSVSVMDPTSELTQDIFAFEQTGVRDGKIEGLLKPTGIRPSFMGKFKANGIDLPPGEFGIPPFDPTQATQTRQGKGRWVAGEAVAQADAAQPSIGRGHAVKAGGMVYVSSVGPVDPATGKVVGSSVKAQTTQCLANLAAKLAAEGSSLEKVVWANWSLRNPEEFDAFNREWVRWFPGDSPIGQGTLMPPQQRRAGFRVSIGVIAEEGGIAPGAATTASPEGDAAPGAATTASRAGNATSSVPLLPAGGERRRADRRASSAALPPGGVDRRRGVRRLTAETSPPPEG